MKEIICKNCGARLDDKSAKDGVIKCESCDSVWTAPKENAPKAVPKKRGRNYWLQFGAWTAALVLLLGVILYFNLSNSTPPPSGITIGAQSPEFSLNKYGYDESGNYDLLDETFNSADVTDKVLVVNFWATWCGGCVEELPEFNEVATEYADDIVMVAIHSKVTEPVVPFIIDQKWTNYNVIFLLDTFAGSSTGDTLVKFGGSNVLPVTFIIGKDGTITYKQVNRMSKNKLVEEIEKALAK